MQRAIHQAPNTALIRRQQFNGSSPASSPVKRLPRALQAIEPHGGAAALTVQAHSPPVELRNWNRCIRTTPTKVVVANDSAHVQTVVRNRECYPSPVSFVGSMHCCNDCLVNDSGTLVSMAGMNKILGLAKHAAGGPTVQVQPGVKLADLHAWLAGQGLELSFCAEIGDATVGSLACCTSKDSSLDGLGHLSALVTRVTYIDGDGHLVTAAQDAPSGALQHYRSCFGLLGPSVEIELQCRPLRPIDTVLQVVPTDKDMPALLQKLRSESDATFAIVQPGGITYIEQRFKTPEGSKPHWYQALLIAALAAYKRISFKVGELVVSPVLQLLPPLNPLLRRLPLRHYRNVFNISYPAVTDRERRLDFTYFEFDASKFESTMLEMLDFVQQHFAATGFRPSALAVYWVRREEGVVSNGVYSSPPGWSVMVDPVYTKPEDPRWHRFNDEINAWAQANGVLHASLTQTKRLPGGEKWTALDPQLVHPRFLTPYYKKFIMADDELKSCADSEEYVAAK